MRQSLGALSHKHCDAALSELRCGWSVQVIMCPYLEISNIVRGLHRWLSGKKNPPAKAGDAGDVGLIPARENGSPFQYSCLGSPMEPGCLQPMESKSQP